MQYVCRVLFLMAVSGSILAAAQRAAEKGNKKAREIVTYFVGQGVGLVDSVKSCRAVVQEFMEDFAEAALACGFADQSHLSRMFKRSTGVTPGRFRGRHESR